MHKFNPWHHVSPAYVKYNCVNGIIGILKGARAMYGLNKTSRLLRLTLYINSSVYYPANYGFIPQTYRQDKKPLDVLILSQIKVGHLCIVQSDIIVVMRILDNGESTDKIIAMTTGDPSMNYYNNILDMPTYFVLEIMISSEDYKNWKIRPWRSKKMLTKDTNTQISEEVFNLYKESYSYLHNYSFGS